MAAAEKVKRTWSVRSILLVVASLFVGVAIGLAGYTFAYAKGFSYLSNDPASCANCHVMDPYYDSWLAGPHQPFATCGDCHTPHDNIVHKYYVKAENGFQHALKFTTGNYPENIEARQVTQDITNQACLYCHADLTNDIRHPGSAEPGEILDCTRCHSNVGHD